MKSVKKKLTTRQVAAEYRHRVRVANQNRRRVQKEDSITPYPTLWRDAAAEVARICTKSSRARARSRLLARAKSCGAMAISATYQDAAALLA